MTDAGSLRFEEAGACLQRVVGEVRKIFVGGQASTEALLVALLSPGHVLLEGVPGVAKTTLVKTFARTLSCSFRRIQFTPDLLPADITGTYVLDPRTGGFSLRRGPVFTQVLLGDEINRAPAKTQSALLEAMQESQVTLEGETCPLPQPFFVLATQNPIEQEGVYALPGAQMDRFLMRCELGYPSEAEEKTLLISHSQPLPEVEAVLSPEQVLGLQGLAAEVHVEPGLVDYMVALIRNTRMNPQVELGASPRACLMLLKAARALAVLRGRGYVLPDDVRSLALPVLGHRIVLDPDAELDGLRAEQVVSQALDSVPYAR